MPDFPARILYVHNSADIYGASRSLLRLTRTIDRQRFTPLVVLPQTGPLVELLESEGVEVTVHSGVKAIDRYVIASWRVIPFLVALPVAILRLRACVKSRNVDLVHTNTGVILTSALAAKLAGCPHVWHVRDWFQEFRSLWIPYSKMITGLSDTIVAVSEAIAGQFANRSKIRVIPNGFTVSEFDVPTTEFRNAFRKRWGIGECIAIGCVGRIKLIRKGQEFLVQAAALLKQRGFEPKIIIVGTVFPGNESHLEALKRQVTEFGLEDLVVFTGEVEDIRTVYPGLDILVLPSAQPEPFGGVVMEAMCMGLPVIATNIGGSPDQVVPEVTGLLVPPADSTALADALERLLQSATLRQQMGKAGRDRINTHFRLEDCVRELENLYLELLGKTPSVPSS